MVTILPQEESIGGNLGRGLGQGISQGLSAQLQDYYKQKQEKRDVENYLNKLRGQEDIEEEYAPKKLERKLKEARAIEGLENEFEPERLERMKGRARATEGLEEEFAPSRLSRKEKELRSVGTIEEEFAGKKAHREQQAKEKEIDRKLKAAQEFLDSPTGKKLPPLTQQLILADAQGVFREGFEKNILEENRKSEEQDFINSLLGAPTSQGGGGLTGIQPAAGEAPAKTGLGRFNEKELQALVAKGGKASELAKFELELRKLDEKAQKLSKEDFRDLRNFESKRSLPILEANDAERKLLPIKKNNLRLIIDSIQSGDVGGFDRDYLAEVTGFEPLRTAKGAQLKTAAKDYFLKDIASLGQRPNQWVEQQVDSAMIKLGKSPAANMTIAKALQFKTDLDEKRVELTDQLEDEYMDTLGYVPGAIGKEVDNLMKDYVQQRQDILAYDLREIYEKEQGVDKLRQLKKVPPGTPLTVEMARILIEKENGDIKKAEQKARQLGFTIPSEEIYKRK